MSMRPLVILFPYHQDDDVTRVHWALLRHHNPGAPVVPLYDRDCVAPGFRPFLPGSVDVSPLPWRWGPNRLAWRNVDTFAARWYAHARTPATDARRFALIEHDVLVTMPLASYFRDVWGADVAGSVIATPETHPGWEWWPDVADQPAAHRAGVMPAAVVLLSRRAMEALSRSTLAAFSEVRIGTAARAAGLTLAAVPGGVETVHCTDRLIRLDDAPGVYHPVKRWGGIDGRCRAAHELGARLAGI
jgi:hypothetical protein